MKGNKKKALFVVLTLLLLLSATACGKAVNPDYPNDADFEADLNAGKNLEGKTVTFTAMELHPDSLMGYNIWAGEHLNFISDTGNDIKAGDRVTVKVNKITSMMGSWFISYDVIRNHGSDN